MAKKKLSWIEKEIGLLKSQGLYNVIRTIQSPIGPKIKVDGKKVLNFCSNNYLGLANNPRLKKAAKGAIDKYGVGPAAVRTIAGTMSFHLELEKRLAKFKRAEAAIVFQGGFLTNLAVIPALVGKDDVIFSDELNHASIIDGARLSKAEVVVYKHKDFADLEKLVMKNSKFPRKLIVTDGVFSMDGDIAPLPEIQKVAEKYDCILIVDDAHGEGVLGEGGRGIANHFNLRGKLDLEIGTMSKAFGVVGGYAAGKKIIIEWLRQRARPFLFSSASTPADTAACLEAVKILEKSDKLVKKLWVNADYFKEEIKNLGFDIGKSETPIVPVMLGDAKIAQEFSKRLFEEGVFAKAVGYPTVPEGKARIRVMISATHTKTHLTKAINAFKKVGKELKILS